MFPKQPLEESSYKPVVEKSLPESAIERPSAANGEPQEINLSIRKSPLRPSGGDSAILGSRDTRRTKLSAEPPVPSKELRPPSFMDQRLMVVIESSPAVEFLVPSSRPKMSAPDSIEASTQSSRLGRLTKIIADQGENPGSLPRVGRPTNRSNVSTPEPHLKRGPGRLPRGLSGAEPNAKRLKADRKVPSPKFIPFLCEWKDCKAELHNLDTLRRHIFTVHNKVQHSGLIVCQWAKCKDPREKFSASARNSNHTYDFETLDEFKEHMQTAHLTPFAWHMGDGPRGSTLDGSESDASQYLRDALGREITPSVAFQVVEGGSARFNNARRMAREKQKYHPDLEAPEAIIPVGAYPMGKGKMTFIDRPTAERPYTFEKPSRGKEQVAKQV